MNESTLPHPHYVDEDKFGCEGCRRACVSVAKNKKAIPPIFTTIDQQLGRKAMDWTRSFLACRECDAIWLLKYNTHEERYEQFPTPLGTAQAMLPGVNLNQIMTLLFANNPVNESAENALWELRYDPQMLWDILTSHWRHPKIEVAQQYAILNQLLNLLLVKNPYHKALQEERSWLIKYPRGFDKDLARLSSTLALESSPWAPFKPLASKNLDALRQILNTQSNLLKEISPNKESTPHTETDKEEPKHSLQPLPIGETLQGYTRQSYTEYVDESTETTHDDSSAGTIYTRTRELLRPYGRFLPAMLVAWLLVERLAASGSESNQFIVQAFFFCFVLVCNGAAVATNAGVSGVGLGRTIWHRLSVVGDYSLFALLLGFILFVYASVANNWDPGLHSKWHILGLSLCLLLALTRLWPFWVISYMQPVLLDEISSRAIGITRRSSLSTAWKLTREPGTFKRRTLPWFFLCGLGGALVFLAAQLFGETGRILILYSFILPILTAFTWAMVEPMPDRYSE